MFYRLYYKKLLSNIFMIIELIVVVIIVNSLISGIIIIYNEHNWYVGTDDVIILELNNSENKANTLETIQALEKTEGIREVGYSALGTVTYNKKDYSSIFYSPALYKMENRITEGCWFNNSEKSQIILSGGVLGSTKKTGETLQLNNVEATVVGVIKIYPYVLELNMKEEKNLIDLSTLSRLANDFILVNSMDMFNDPNFVLYSNNVALFTDNKFSPESVEKYGKVHHISEYIEASQKRYKIENNMEIITAILTMAVIITIIEGFKIIIIKSKTNLVLILKYCGMSFSHYFRIMFGHIILNVLIALFISLCILTNLDFIHTLLGGASINLFNAVSTFIIVAITILYNALTVTRQYNSVKCK